MQPVVQLENVTKTYSNGEVEVHAVRGITLQVMPGEFVAIMGSSGSGKSTLMNVLGCLDRPTSGRYLLDGVDTSGLERNERADLRNRKLGFVGPVVRTFVLDTGAECDAETLSLREVEDGRQRHESRLGRLLGICGMDEQERYEAQHGAADAGFPCSHLWCLAALQNRQPNDTVAANGS